MILYEDCEEENIKRGLEKLLRKSKKNKSFFVSMYAIINCGIEFSKEKGYEINRLENKYNKIYEKYFGGLE